MWIIGECQQKKSTQQEEKPLIEEELTTQAQNREAKHTGRTHRLHADEMYPAELTRCTIRLLTQPGAQGYSYGYGYVPCNQGKDIRQPLLCWLWVEQIASPSHALL